MRWLGRERGLDRDEAWRELAYLLGHWDLRGYGQWLLEEQSHRRARRAAPASTCPRAGRGSRWAGPSARRTGATATPPRPAGPRSTGPYAELAAEHVISLIAPANDRSRRVAERLGLVHEGRTRVRGHLVHVYGIERPAP